MLLPPVNIADFSGGTNLRDAPLLLGPTDLIECLNMVPLAGGLIQGRSGQAEYNATQIDANPIKSLYRFYKQTGTGIMLATSGTQVYKGDDVAGTFSSIDTGYTTGQRFSFTSWSAKDKVYWTNGVEVVKSYDGTTVAVLGGTPPVCTQIEFHQDRLWALQQNLVRFSDLNVDDVWPALSALNVSDNRGGQSQWIKSANSVFIVGKTSGLWRFEGSPLLGGQLIQYSAVSCNSPWTAKTVNITVEGRTVPIAVTFTAVDGAYITDGYTVDRISPKIDPVFTANLTGAVAEYYPKLRQYWLSFNAAGGANDTLWVATKLDRPEGSVVAWSQYTGFNIDSMCVWDQDSGELYAGQSDAGKVRHLDTGQQDVGSDYKCSVSSRYFDFSAPGINKSVRWIKALFEAQSTVSYRLDYLNAGQRSGSVKQEISVAGKWNVDQWNSAKWGGTGIKHTRTSTLFSGQGRFAGVTLWNIGDGPGFKIHLATMEARTKDKRIFNLFTLYNDAAVT
jgi:hypothetical protein